MRGMWVLAGVGVLLLAAGGASNEKVRGWVMAPRGIRNNNPGNLRRNATAWQGLAPAQSDSEFFQFVAPVWGIRALARTLRTYVHSHNLATVREIVNRWAPPVGRDSVGRSYTQNTDAYTRHVAAAVGVSPDQALAFSAGQLEALVTAIIRHENGQQPYSVALIREGIAAAGWM